MADTDFTSAIVRLHIKDGVAAVQPLEPPVSDEEMATQAEAIMRWAKILAAGNPNVLPCTCPPLTDEEKRTGRAWYANGCPFHEAAKASAFRMMGDDPPTPVADEALVVARGAELFAEQPPQYQAHVTLVAGGFWVSTAEPREDRSRLYACADFDEMVAVLRSRFG